MKETKMNLPIYCRFSVRYISSNMTKVLLLLLILLTLTLSRYVGTFEYTYSSFRLQI
jgi:hypothetical protein